MIFWFCAILRVMETQLVSSSCYCDLPFVDNWIPFSWIELNWIVGLIWLRWFGLIELSCVGFIEQQHCCGITLNILLSLSSVSTATNLLCTKFQWTLSAFVSVSVGASWCKWGPLAPPGKRVGDSNYWRTTDDSAFASAPLIFPHLEQSVVISVQNAAPLWWQLHLCLITSVECWLFLQGHWVNAASTTPATPATCCWTELLKCSFGALLTFFFMPEGERFSGERLNAAADVSKARLPHRRNIIKLYVLTAPTQLWNTSKLHIRGMRRIGRLIYGSVDSWTRCFLSTASLMAPVKRKNLPLQCVHAWVHNPSPEVFRTGSSARRAVTGGVTMWLWINVEGDRWKLENVHESMTMWGKLQEPRRMCVTAEGKMKAAYISPILVNFEGNSSVRRWTALHTFTAERRESFFCREIMLIKMIIIKNKIKPQFLFSFSQSREAEWTGVEQSIRTP